MDFLGIGPLEIALVVLIAFIVLGPERIPGVMRQLGTWTRQLRETVNNLTRDYNADIQQLTGEITALQDEIRNIQRDLGGIATGFMATTLPPQQPPAQSNTAATANPLESETPATPSIAPDLKRPAPSPESTPPGTDADESYKI